MKKYMIAATIIAALSAESFAREVSYADVVSNPSQYVGKTVIMSGAFAYSEPMRESFSLDQNGNLVEVFYSDLPADVRQLILSRQKDSKEKVIVSGLVRPYANKSGSYFINASSLRFEKGSPALPYRNVISYGEIRTKPDQYINRQVTMRGAFLYGEPMRQSFTLDESGNLIEVLLGDLPKIDRDLVLSQASYSKIPIVVTGVLKAYSNNTKTYFINASIVNLEN